MDGLFIYSNKYILLHSVTINEIQIASTKKKMFSSFGDASSAAVVSG